MRIINFKLLAELTGVLAIVGSLIFVGLQIQQEQRVAESEVFMSALEAKVGIDAAVAEHAEIWVKAKNTSDLNEVESQVMESLVMMYRDRAFFESMATLTIDGASGPLDFSQASGPTLSFAVLLHKNPGAQRIWFNLADREARYFERPGGINVVESFNDAVKAHLAALNKRLGDQPI